MSPLLLPPAPGAVTLEQVLITAQLSARPARGPDPATERRAMRRLADSFAGPPQGIYQALVDAALDLCRAGTAGLSLLETGPDGASVFRWTVLAGALASSVGGYTPRDFSPCGVTLDRGCAQLFDRPARLFEYFRDASPEILEGLVVPVPGPDGPWGTIWVVSHDLARRFDAEDARVLTSLAAFTAAGAAAARLHQAEREAHDALTTKSDQLRRSNADLEDFASIIAHDVKEPLRGIRAYATFVAEDYAQLLPPEGLQKLATIGRLAERTAGLLESLLEYSRVSHAELSVREVDLNGVVAETLDLVRDRIEAEGVQVHVGTLPTARCDPGRMGQVLANLITNGIKYNTSVPKRVEVGCVDPSAERAVLYVRDNGIGIDPKHHGTIFRMFKRLHSRDSYGGGSGAGLAIARKLIDRHGGRIWVESQVGRGTTLYFTLAPGARDDDA